MAYIGSSDLKEWLGTTSTADDGLLGTLCTAAQAEIDAFCGRSFEATTGTRYYRPNDLVDIPASAHPARYSYDNRLITSGIGLDGGRTYLSNVYTRRVLWLSEDLLALGGLTNGDGTTIASTDCWLEPRNEAPYQCIRLKTAESWSFGTDGEITVSGTWGYSTSAPATIVQYTKEIGAYIYRMRDAAVYDVVANPESGTITVPKGVPAHVKQGLIRGGYVARLAKLRIL